MDGNMIEFTISIDVAELMKSIMAELALSIASKPHEEDIASTLLLDRCNVRELVAIKVRESCLSLCGRLAGYVSSVSATGDVTAILMKVPLSLGTVRCDLLRELFEKAVVKAVLYEFLKGSAFDTEIEESKSAQLSAESRIKQMLALE